MRLRRPSAPPRRRRPGRPTRRFPLRPPGSWCAFLRSSVRSPSLATRGPHPEHRANGRGVRRTTWRPLLPRFGEAGLDARDGAGTECAVYLHLARVFTHAERPSPAPGPAPASAAWVFRAARRALGSRAPPRLSRAFKAILDHHGREHVCLKDSKRGEPEGGGRLRRSRPGATDPGVSGSSRGRRRSPQARERAPDYAGLTKGPGAARFGRNGTLPDSATPSES